MSKKLPNNCPICGTSWTKRQSPWFRNLEYVHCSTCEVSAENIIKRVEKDPSLKKKKVNDVDNSDWLNSRDWYDYWRD